MVMGLLNDSKSWGGSVTAVLAIFEVSKRNPDKQKFTENRIGLFHTHPQDREDSKA